MIKLTILTKLYDYKCNYHDLMIASITVVEPEIVWADYDFSKANSTKHSPIIGFAFDGYPIYGAYGAVDGEITKMKSNYILKSGETGSNGIDDYIYSVDNGGHLDACNGVFGVTPEFPEGIYHYHSTVPTEKGSVTATNNAFPYFVNCYRGNAEDSNFDGGALGGGGGPGFVGRRVVEVTREVRDQVARVVLGAVDEARFPSA